jgi:hypothetical protein
VPLADLARRRERMRLFEPLTLWETGVSRFGVFPEMQTFGLRLLLRWRELQRRHRFDVVFDNQCLSWGLLGIQAAGVPVVSVIHHPLHLDREADFAIDPSLKKRIRRTLYFPLLMQQLVAPRLGRDRHRQRGLAQRDRALLRDPGEAGAVVYNGTDAELFRPTPDGRSRPTCSSWGAPRTARRGSARCSRRWPCCRST